MDEPVPTSLPTDLLITVYCLPIPPLHQCRERLCHNQIRNVKNSQYITKKITTQRIKPSIPRPLIVKHECAIASTAARIAVCFHLDG
jgi:hypothetical protein